MPMLSTFGGGSARGFKSDKQLIEFIDTYNYTGTSQSFNIPSGVTEVEAYVFGPGGGAEGDTNTKGGAGGYSVGTINTSAGGTLRIIVGGAGGPGSQSNGSGGGYSGVFTSSWQGNSPSTDHAAAIIVAGGGGGSADSSTNADGGGAGGYPNGQQGSPSGSGGGGGGGNPNGGNGGGGSGYIGGSGSYTVSNGAGYSGNFDVPATQATSSPYYTTGISRGGIHNINNGGNGVHSGGHGKVVLRYFA